MPTPTPAPNLQVVGGINIASTEPINPSWKPSVETAVFGQGNHFVADPSNGGRCNPPQPTRSPAGYPYFYAIDGNGSAVGSPMVLYAGHSFVSDAAVETYKAAVAKAAADQAAADANASNKLYTGPVSSVGLSTADLMYLNYLMHQPGKTNISFTLLNGTQVQINAAINAANDLSPQMSKFNPATYTGVLKHFA
ncbi:MAG: hypothetical protein ACYC9R_06350 [Nitrosotalea sp.]